MLSCSLAYVSRHLAHLLCARRKNITQTLSSLSKTGQGRPISDTEILKWANTTAQKAKATVRPIRSFKDPSLTTGIFLLDLLEALRPGIVDPTLIINVSDTGDYEERRQNGMRIASGHVTVSLTTPLTTYSETRHLDCP